MEDLNVEYEVRNMRTNEIPLLRELTDNASWNISEEYLRFCYNMYPEGFYVAVTPAGQLIGHCGAVAVNEKLGYIMFYITKPIYQGRGIGTQVWKAAIRSLGNRNICLNSNFGKEAMYASGGFKYSTYRTYGYLAVPNYASVNSLPEDESVQIVDGQTVPFEQLNAFDRTVCPVERREFLQQWISPSRSQTFVALNKGTVCGYACRWQAANGFRVMPLYANDPVIAKMLWKAVIGSAPIGTQFEVGCPIENSDGLQLFCSTLTPNNQKTNVKMFSNEVVAVSCSNVYSVCGYDIVLL